MREQDESPVSGANRAWVVGVAILVLSAAVVPLLLLPPSFKPSENVTYVGILVTAIGKLATAVDGSLAVPTPA